MSRWHQDPPDEDRFNDRPIDVQDEPQDDPEPPVEPFEARITTLTPIEAETLTLQATYNRFQSQMLDSVDPPVDPAEHAAHDMIDALSRFEREIALAGDADRMFTIWHALQRVTARCLEVADKAGDKTERLIGGRR